jgi:RNA polymerase sigma-70 factor (ECF subfamily)
MSENFEPLVEAARGGDEHAFRALVEPLRRELHAYAYRMLGGFHDADDVIQESQLKAWRALATYEPRASFRAWMYRIVMNVAIDHLRRRGRAVSVDYDDAIAHAEDDALAGLEALSPQLLRGDPRKEVQRSEIREQLSAALEKLSPEHRSVLVMREVDGMSYEDMAKVMKCPKGTIMSRLFHARKNM